MHHDQLWWQINYLKRNVPSCCHKLSKWIVCHRQCDAMVLLLKLGGCCVKKLPVDNHNIDTFSCWKQEIRTIIGKQWEWLEPEWNWWDITRKRDRMITRKKKINNIPIICHLNWNELFNYPQHVHSCMLLYILSVWVLLHRIRFEYVCTSSHYVLPAVRVKYHLSFFCSHCVAHFLSFYLLAVST